MGAQGTGGTRRRHPASVVGRAATARPRRAAVPESVARAAPDPARSEHRQGRREASHRRGIVAPDRPCTAAGADSDRRAAVPAMVISRDARHHRHAPARVPARRYYAIAPAVAGARRYSPPFTAVASPDRRGVRRLRHCPVPGLAWQAQIVFDSQPDVQRRLTRLAAGTAGRGDHHGAVGGAAGALQRLSWR